MKVMAFWPEEKRNIKDNGVKLRLLHAEYLILLEKHQAAIKEFISLANSKNDLLRALAYIGIATALDLEFRPHSKEKAESYCQWIISQKNLEKEPIYARAILLIGDLRISMSGMHNNALPFYLQYIEKFPDGRDIRKAKYYAAYCYFSTARKGQAVRLFQQLSVQDDIYSMMLKEMLKKSN